ncbi:uncharacterized protein M6B38_101290 [Iris pallida]|uniref:Uncharacterized protein n=1 Tax=Iris pallida TaxID=29817 RepID=A0AAX6IM67_IRIPA|nr:uncharacterized protein M6B38_101290 [Iris pallida]
MLELLHKVDQSRDNSTFPGFGNSNHSTLHGTYRSAGSDFHRQHHQTSAFQGVGLQLAPPPQQSDRSLNPSHEASQREIQDSSANLSGEACKEVLHSATQENSAGFYHLKSSSEQPPMAETGPLLQAFAASSMTRQIDFSMLQNVWTNASLQQRISCFQPPNLNSNVPQSTILASTCRDSASVLKEDDQGRKGESLPSELASCSNKSQQIVYGEDNPFRFNSLRQTPSENGDVRGCALEVHSEGNSFVPVSSMELLPRREANKAKHGQDSFFNTQSESVSMANMASPKSNIKHGCSMLPSDFQQTNYSLLQQMQAMKRAGFDPSKIDGKRLKSDFSSDASQGYIYGPNADNIVPSDGELCTVSHNSFSHDVEMLSFSSREHEEKFAGGTCKLVVRDVPSQVLYTSVHHDNDIPTQALSSTSNCIRNGHPQISPQMAPSWLEHYRDKNGQILAMHADQRNARAAPQQCFSAEIAERMGSNPSVEQRIESSQFSSPSHSTSPSPKAANKFSPHLPLDMIDHDTITGPKKRKLAALEILPWHQEVVAGLQIPQSISSTEREWACSANRLTEKVEDEAELKEDGTLVPRARRRLILTTQLMQQLLPPVPAPILASEVTSTYEHVTYFLAKSALGRACSMISCSGSDSWEHLDSGNRMLDKVQKAREFFFSKIVEDFIGRSRKLESDLLRLDKGTSVIDLRLECQDLERFSLVNRLGKFHGQCQAHGVESSSSSQSATRKLLPHKYVNGIPVPGSLPEGVICFSL